MTIKYLKSLGVAVVVCASAQAASADDAGYKPNLYVSAGAGLSVILDKDVTLRSTGNPTSILTAGFDTGIALSGAVGTKLPYGFRAELEAGFSNNAFGDSINAIAPIPGVVDASGETQVTTFIANLLYDHDVTDAFGLFLGAGAGVAIVDVNLRRGLAQPTIIIARGSDTRFAYQAIVGGSYDITDDIEFWGRYSYLGTVGNNFSALNTGVNMIIQADVPIDRHTAMIGFTAHFGLTD